jgi:hypothetical protein
MGARRRAGVQHVEGLTEVTALDQQADQPEDRAAERCRFVVHDEA